MKRFEIPCVIAAAALSVSCVHQVRTAASYPTAPPPAQESRPVSSAMERQIAGAVDAGEGDYVVRSLRRKMAAEPGNLAVRLELIGSYTRAGYPELALEHCRLAVERFPESAEVQLSLAKLLRTLKMPKEAAAGLGAFLETHPQQSPAYDSWLGILRDELGDWKAGETSHRAALALAPALDYLHNNLGYNLLMQKRPSEAAFEFRQALKLKPDSETARNNLGMALAGTPGDAVLHWQSVSDPATAHSNMAAMLIEQGRYPEARKELDLALGYNKSHAAALSNLKLVSELDGKPAVIPLKPIRSGWSKFFSAVFKVVGG
ncbi:MAG TPA: tetratricopeptide repeat protein [Bryobacteraceae bacterium]|nr:tetratricopeptide repeat protein [Bryobacteraceae bacterium]